MMLTFFQKYGTICIMKNIIITDAHYRASLAAVHALAGKNYNLILCQTDDCKKIPLSFKSKYVKKAVILHAENYFDELISLIREYERPIVVPIGAKTTELLSNNKDVFSQYCDFLVPSVQALNDANNKNTVAEIARKLNIPTPKQYDGEPEKYPVIIKPYCGEKFGLHAEQRYIRADDRVQYLDALEKMKKYDPSPIVQEYIEGDGMGVCMLMTEAREVAGLICHKRVRELPINGGPSTCCETIYDQKYIDYAKDILKDLNFSGICMVEFKGGKLLEINPRVWGSFPLTFKAHSNFTQNWVKCASGEKYDEPEYKIGIKMYFIVNDTIAAFKYLLSGKIGNFFGFLADLFNPKVKEALFFSKDPKPFLQYIKNLFTRG